MASAERVIIVGSGFAAVSAACEVIEQGNNVTIIEKNRLGGNSAKSISGIAVPGNSLQAKEGISDDLATFEADAGVAEGSSTVLANGATDLEWLSSNVGFASDLVLRHAPGHSVPRVLATKEHNPGMVMTYKTLHALQLLARKYPERVEIFSNAEVKKIVTEEDSVVGVEYEHNAVMKELRGPVIMATGGFAGDSSPLGLLANHRPDLARLPTTTDDRASGRGIVLCSEVGAATEQMDKIHLTPMGLGKHDSDEDEALLPVVADTLLGSGAILLDRHGKRFCDELGTSESRMMAMMNESSRGPFRLVIGETASARVNWITEFYAGKGRMLKFRNASELASDMGVSASELTANLEEYCKVAAEHAEGSLDDESAEKHFLGQFKRYFSGQVLATGATLIDTSDNMYAAIVKPALYSCSGGLATDGASVLSNDGTPIKGLYAAGEVASFPHEGLWSMTGVPLLHALTTGRAAGRAIAKEMFGASGEVLEENSIKSMIVSATSVSLNIDENASDKDVQEDSDKKPEEMTQEELIDLVKKLREGGAVAAAPVEEGPPTFTEAEVAKHNTPADAWVIINGDVIDVTKWIPIHPGGEKAICEFLGKDASDEWNAIHKPGTVEQKALVTDGPVILGKVGNGKAAAAAPSTADAGIPISEVAKHNKQGDAWVAINGKVYDVTEWIDVHPGGVQAICAFIGTDASDEWNTIHKPGTVEQNQYPVNPKGPKLLGELQGGGGGSAPVAAGPPAAPPPEGEGCCPGYIGAIFYMAMNWIRLILKTVFFTGNFQVTAERAGTVRSAAFLVFFIIIHAVGNLEIFMGSKEYNGYAYLYERLWFSQFGIPIAANFVELYLLMALVVHVCVALKRSYDITINYCLNTGKWRMLLTGLCTLCFLINHMQDFRFNNNTGKVGIRPPPMYFAFDGITEGRFWYMGEDSGIPEVAVRDVANLVFTAFSSFGNVMFYTVCIVLFIVHAYTGWAKLVPSEVFFLPVGHVKKVTLIGQSLIVFLGAIYLSFPWYIFIIGGDSLRDDHILTTHA